jgi:hypothetical protein
MKPYLKGFHLSLEMWQGNCVIEGWKVKGSGRAWQALYQRGTEHLGQSQGTTIRYHMAVPRPIQDLSVLLLPMKDEHPAMRCVRSNLVMMAYYGFGNASSSVGFGSTAELPDGLHSRFGLLGRYAKYKSIKYRELRNLVVEVAEEKAANGHLRDAELQILLFQRGIKVVHPTAQGNL